MAPNLDARHHTFMQALMNRGPVSDKLALSMYKGLFRVDTDHGFVQFLGAINTELQFVKMEVKKVQNQYDGKSFYGIVNTQSSKEAKLGTKYTAGQILFFTAVMEAIVRESEGTGLIGNITALNLSIEPQGESQSQRAKTQIPRMTMPAKEDALSLLTADQFLSRTAEGSVGLGVKAFLELRTLFRTLDAVLCTGCTEAAIKAEVCSKEDCDGRIHAYCLVKQQFQTRSNQRPRCKCGTPWNPVVVGDDGSQSPEPEQPYVEAIATQPEPKSRPPAARKKLKRKAVINEDEESERDQPPVEGRRTRSRKV